MEGGVIGTAVVDDDVAVALMATNGEPGSDNAASGNVGTRFSPELELDFDVVIGGGGSKAGFGEVAGEGE